MRGKLASTEENLEAAFQMEIRANADEYPNTHQGCLRWAEKRAVKAFSNARDMESRHAELYKKAMNDMPADRQTDYYVCQICGYIN